MPIEKVVLWRNPCEENKIIDEVQVDKGCCRFATALI